MHRRCLLRHSMPLLLRAQIDGRTGVLRGSANRHALMKICGANVVRSLHVASGFSSIEPPTLTSLRTSVGGSLAAQDALGSSSFSAQGRPTSTVLQGGHVLCLNE